MTSEGKAILVVAAVACLTVAAPARAAKVTYGSDLSAPAVIAHSTPNDAVYFNDALAGGAPASVAVTGQVIEVQVKGRLVASPYTLAGGPTPFNTFHFQVLRPAANGAWTVPAAGTSTDQTMPWNVGDDQVTTFHTTSTNDALCVKPGDRLDFASLGGWDYASGYNDGTPFQIFGRVPGSRVLQYSAAGTEGVHNGQTFTPQDTREGEELLMRYVVGTGDDARPACREATTTTPPATTTPGTTKKTTPKVTLPRGQRPTLPKTMILGIAAFCHDKTAPCRGKLTARAKRKAIGSKKYAIPAGRTQSVKVKLTKSGRRLFEKGKRKLKITVTVVTEPGGAEHTDSMALTVKRR